MSRVLDRLFDLREGERVQLVTLGATLFTIIAAHIMMETARDALFLGNIDASRLAWVYAALAGLVMVVLTANGHLVRRFGRRNALIATLMGSGYGTVVFYLLPRTQVVVFGLYLWSALLGTVVVVQFWMLAGELFTVTQGKRLFGPLAAAGALGALIGASSASGLLAFFPVDSLLLVSAVIFLATGFLLTTVQDARVTIPPRPVAPGIKSTRSLLDALREQPYLVRLSLLLILATAVVLIADYMFKSVAARTLEPEQLGSFFAGYYAVITAVALVFQLLLSAQIVRRIGLLAAVAVMPLCLLLSGGAVLLVGGAIAAVLITKGVDGALRHSLHRVSVELLWMPVSGPARNRAKGVIDGVLVRAVQAVTAVALFGLAAFGLDHPRFLAGGIAVLSLLWLGVAISLRKPYLTLFRNALSRRSVDVRGHLDLDSVEILVEALSSLDDARVIAAIQLLAEKDRTRLIPGLILYHESPEVIAKALEVIPTPARRDWVPLTERRLLQHSSEKVRIAALSALARNNLLSHFEERLGDVSPAVRAHAVFWLAQESAAEDKLELATVRQLLAIQGEAGRSARLALCNAISADGDETWGSALLELIRDDSPEVIEAAALATKRVPDERFIPILIDRLGIRSGRGTVRSAIVALGEPALDALEAAFLADHTNPRVKLHIPRTIAYFGSQRAADFLVAQVTQQTGLMRYKILRSVYRMVLGESQVRIEDARIMAGLDRNLREYFRLLATVLPLEAGLETVPAEARESGNLLASLLHDKLRQALQRCFMILQIAHRDEDIRSLYFAVTVGDKTQRANAVEFVDALTRNSLYDSPTAERMREWLRVVAENLSPHEKIQRVKSAIVDSPGTYRDCLSALMSDSDATIAAIAVFHAIELGDKSLQKELESAAKDATIRDALGYSADEVVATNAGERDVG